MEMTNKRKSDEGQEEQPQKKNRSQQEERWVKRSTDDWETFAKDSKAGAQRREDENKKAKIGDDMDDETMVEATGAIGLNESDLKHNEVEDKFSNQSSEETFGELRDAISGEVLDSELIKKVREAEMRCSGSTRCTRRFPWRSAGKSSGEPLLE